MMCGNNMSNSMNTAEQLRESRFAVIDSAMFLDTHPDDSAALEFYRRKQQKFEQAKAEYQQKIGPLDIFDVDVSNGCWQWTDEPWPWQL